MSVDQDDSVSELEKAKLRAFFEEQKSNERVGILAFYKLPCIKKSPIGDLILKSLEKELSGRRITFPEFLSYLSVLHNLCPPPLKHAYLYPLISNPEGTVTKVEIRNLVCRLKGIDSDTTDEKGLRTLEKIDNFVKQIMETFDDNSDGRISQEEFEKALSEPEIGKIVQLASLDFNYWDNSEAFQPQEED